MQAALTRERRAHRGPGSLYDVAGFLGEATVRAMMAASAASTTQAIGNPVSWVGVGAGLGAAGIQVGEARYGSRPFVSCARSGVNSDACIQWTGPEPMLFARIALAEGT